jgi:hypothetical protein
MTETQHVHIVESIARSMENEIYKILTPSANGFPSHK